VLSTISEADIRELSPGERARLSRLLAELATEDIAAGPLRGTHRRRFIKFATLVCLVLLPWTAFLAITLPPAFTADQWGLTWTGFDVALIAVIGLTGWAAVRRRQVVVVGLIVWGTLLTCDAWFDVTLDWGSRGASASLATAAFVELPVAAFSFLAARKLLLRTFWTARLRSGVGEPVRRLRNIEMFSLREHGPDGVSGIPIPPPD
jgi:hypothetical protein